MTTLPTAPPLAFEAGTTVAFTQAPVSHALGEISPATGWALVWLLRGAQAEDVVATVEGALWRVTFAAAANTITAGLYAWSLRATKALEVVTVSRGTVTVRADVAIAIDGDLESWPATMLPKVRTAIRELIEGGAQFTMIGDRQWNAIDLDKLLRLESQLEAKLALQGSRSGFGIPVRPTAGYLR